MTHQEKLERNIHKYSWYKIFTKRIYLPLITIQLVSVGKVTLEELAIIGIVSALVQGILQVPSGYFADKIGNRISIILGALISAFSPLFYIFMPNFTGGMIASVLFFAGFAFQSGAIEAFIHDTLVALRREDEYTKVMGRAQTYGLIGNVVLVALVPMTYAIHHTLPFILGFVSLLIMFFLTISFEHPEVKHSTVETKSPIKALRSVVTLENSILFIFAGFLSRVTNKIGEFRELLLQDLGVLVSFFGLIMAAGSLGGAIIGWHLHIFDRMRAGTFYLFDLLLIASCLVLMGVTSDIRIVLPVVIILMAYGRVRSILFQSKILHGKSHVYKATLISAMGSFTLFGDIVVITTLTYFIVGHGYSRGYELFGLFVFAIGIVLWAFIVGESYFRKIKQRT